MNLNWKIDSQRERATTTTSDGRNVIVEIVQSRSGCTARMTITGSGLRRRETLPATFGYDINAAIADAESMHLCV